MKKITGLVAAIALSSSTGFANEFNQHSVNMISEANSAAEKEASLLLSQEEKILASQWQLKATDWVKYRQIMSGPRGIWSPGLDPLTALGVSETDPRERKRYAEIWMKMEIRRTELELAFEVERMKAGKRLNGDRLAVNNTAWIEAWEKEQNKTTHQIQLFMDVNCIEDCRELFESVRKSVGKHSRLDIYFKDGVGSESIGFWAGEMGIDPSLVRSRKVTLNHDEGRAKSMGLKESDFPAVKVIELETGTVTDTYENI